LDEEKLFFPELGLALAGEPRGEEEFQAVHRRKELVGTPERPAADFLDRDRRHQVHGNTLAMRGSEFGAHAAVVNRVGIPMADDVIGFALDEFEVEGDDFPSNAAEAVHVGHFPMAEIDDFFRGEILAIVFDGVVHAVPELFPQKGAELLPPEICNLSGGLNGTTEISKHGQGAADYHGEMQLTMARAVEKNGAKNQMERDKGIEPSPRPWQGRVLPLYESRLYRLQNSQSEILAQGLRRSPN
jgi:hypothetical protein